MRLLYGTSNTAKLEHMRKALVGLNLDIIGLKDIDIEIGQIEEDGNNPLENARIKALAYYEATRMPVFSCDSGLYLEGLPEALQPGVHVRRVEGKHLDDEEMIEYYSRLAQKHGGSIRARYKNAIALVIDDQNVYTYDGDQIASVEFLITSKPHPKRELGFPIDSISIEIESMTYYMDIKNRGTDYYSTMVRGFRNFFERHLRG